MPCEVYRLLRADYERVVGGMPKAARRSVLHTIVEKLWALVCNENRGRTLVDFAVYMQLHLRIAKALSAEDAFFDEAEEWLCTQTDWAEDCARFGLGVAGELDKQTFIQAG